MDTTATCLNCSQSWAIVPGQQIAHPGQTVDGRWRWDGPTIPMNSRGWGTETIYSFPCHCGMTLEWSQPAVELVECRHQAGAAGVCAKRALQRNPPQDLYVNKRYGASCPCCGHQGTHWVRVDREGHLPACLKVEVKA